MNYPRVPYKAEGAGSIQKKSPISPRGYEVPVIDYPISPVENFKLSWKKQTPVWVPNSLLEFDSIGMGKTSPYAHLMAKNERFDFIDFYGCEYTYIPEVRGAMLKPGTCLLEDVLDWEKIVKFPDWKAYDFKTQADEFHSNRQNPDSVLSIDLGSIGTEVLISLLGGYEQGMVAMAVDPEAVLDLMHAINESLAVKFDQVLAHYPSVAMITVHDDWANAKDTFFSEKYFEDMVAEPTKNLIDHIKASGDICLQLHCCGKMMRFLPYIVDLGVDMLQIQRNLNDFAEIKQKYGKKLGFGGGIEGVGMNPDIPREEWFEKIRQTIDLYGKSGGFFLAQMGFPQDEELLWDICYESYCYSREYYDKERN